MWKSSIYGWGTKKRYRWEWKPIEIIEKEITGFYCCKCEKIASTFEEMKEVAKFIED